MIIPIALLLSGAIAYAGNKAIPAVWHHKLDVEQTRLEAAKDLCDKHNDCEAYKVYALQGMKKVVRLEAAPVKDVPAQPMTPVDEIKALP